MSWERVIKFIKPTHPAVQIARKRMWQHQLERTDEDSNQVELDKTIQSEGCCETARGQMLDIFNMMEERYKQQNRPDKVKGVEENFRILETLPCEVLRKELVKLSKLGRVATAGMKINPEVLEFRRILKEWKECESGGF